jgi:hypothetical protein
MWCEYDGGGLASAAAILGRKGGLVGGPARAASLSRSRRIEIARHAAKVRWVRRRRGHDAAAALLALERLRQDIRAEEEELAVALEMLDTAATMLSPEEIVAIARAAQKGN